MLVEVTTTDMMMADGRMPDRFTFARSSLLARARTERMYMLGSVTSCSSSGKRAE